MTGDNRPEIVVDGDVSPLRQKLREAGNHFKQFAAEGESAVNRITGPLATLQSKFIALGALLAGGAVFKAAVDETVKLTEESTKLGRALGISASEASILREALTAGNTSQDEFIAAGKGLAKQLRTNEEGLNAMGLKTRDAAGQLRPLNDLIFDAIDVVNGYRAGTDRAVAGQVAFGKGFEMTSNLALLNKKAVGEVAEQMRELGTVVSAENVAAWQAFDDAGDKATITLKGIKTTIGNVLLPVLTMLAGWFSSIGPAAVTVIKGALGGLASAFYLVTTGVTVLWETLNAMVVTVAEPIRALSEAIGLGLAGDFKGAAAALGAGGTTIANAWSQAFDQMAAKAQSTRDRIYAIFTGERTAAAAPGKDSKGADGLVEKKKLPPLPDSYMPYLEAALAERKDAYEKENVLRQFSKEQELAYWRELLANLEITSKDKVSIAKRTATLELEIRRQAAKDQRDLDAVGVDHRRQATLAQIALEEQSARFARDNRSITQLELIALEEDFARRKFEIEYQSLLERIELAKTDPNQSPAARAQLNEQLLELERQYQLRLGELKQGKKKEEGGGGGLFDDIGTSFGNAANAMLTTATTLQQQLGNIFSSIYQSFITNLITKPLGEWIAVQARMLAVKLGFVSAEKAINVGSAAATVATKAAEGGAVVAVNAAEAGSGAAASQASIPFIGPVLALAAMATVFAAVMALGKKKSAMGGYDIPRGLNPLTQLHEEEMVLPQKFANVIRNMAANSQGEVGGGDGGGAPVTFQVSAIDAAGVKQFFDRHGAQLVETLRGQGRSFNVGRK